MGEFSVEDHVYDEVSRHGEAERQNMPRPVSARFDDVSERIIVEFENGAAFVVPARLLQGLEDASKQEIAAIQLNGETGLHWESLDVDFTIVGLMRGVFGTVKFMEAAKRGGQSRSEAKVAASRINGLKGGRPRKIN